MTARRKVLVVGGAGAFGGRLVDGLLATTGLEVIVAGRDRARTERFLAARASLRHRLGAATLDTATADVAALRASEAFLVVDAAGPYQGGEYRLARAAIAAGMHYVDLADARDFVGGFACLDAAARAAGGGCPAPARRPPYRTPCSTGSRKDGGRWTGCGWRSRPATGRRAGCRWCGRSCPTPGGRCGCCWTARGGPGPAGA